MKFQFFLAKLFGEPLQAANEGATYTGYFWRDRFFVTDITLVPVDPPSSSRTS